MYRNTGKTHSRVILWGARSSAWSGKMRSYLIKKGIDFEERSPSEDRFVREILPTIGYFVVPVTELRDGTLLQGSTDAILRLEQLHEHPKLVPQTPFLRAVAFLLNMFGSDSFSMPALHYRWSYADKQRSFLEHTFSSWVPSNPDPNEKGKQLQSRMSVYANMRPFFGITETSVGAIEASWLECLDVLGAHFSCYPYLLGGRPSLADFGLVTAFYAHFARDPYSSTILKNRAPDVFRWTERMNERGYFDGDFPDLYQDYYQEDALPKSLEPFLRYLLVDCGPQFEAAVLAYNSRTGEFRKNGGAVLPSGSIKTAHPGFAAIEYELRGETVKRAAFASTVYEFQQVTAQVDLLDAAAMGRFSTLVRKLGGEWILNLRLISPLIYRNYEYFLDDAHPEH